MSDTGFGAVFARRAAISFFICVVLFFSCILRVAVSALTDYSAVLNRQSGYRLTVGKLRGTIYDRNMVPLTNAESKIIAAVSPTPRAVTAVSGALYGDELQGVLEKLKGGKPVLCEVPQEIDCGGVYWLFFSRSFSYAGFMKAAFVGIVFAATSVSITVETLNEMGKLKTKVGATLLSAAIIDDIIGIVVLSILSAMGDSSVSPAMVTLKIFGFFVFTAVVGFIVYKVFKRIAVNHATSRRVAVWAMAFCFIMAFCAERFFGVADITGAYFAGVILCNVTDSRRYVAKKVTAASYLVFSPVFFAGIGLKTELNGITPNIIVFALVLAVMAVITKIIGCGLGARLCKMTPHESLTVGVGMVARGEVALMVAQKGIDSGNIDPHVFPAIVLCVVIAALVTPVLLKLVISKGDAAGGNTEPQPAA